MKRCFVFLVALCFCTALAFAAGGGQSSGSSGGLTTIKLMQGGPVPTGILSGYHWTETLAKDLGIQLEYVSSEADALQAMIAARDLPELINLNSGSSHVADIIRARLVQDLEPYKARLPNVFKWTGMIQYMKDNWSDGQGKVYAVRLGVGNKGNTSGVGNGPYVRWDYYKELGYPEITTLEDYLPVLKAMQDRHPVNDAGQRVYALSYFPTWDGHIPGFGNMFTSVLGKMSPGGYLEVDIQTNAVNSMLDDNSAYKRNLKFFYDANKLGILDPDSPTQTYDIWREKGAAGRHILSWWWWGNDNLLNATELATQGKGFMLFPFKNMKVQNTSTPPYVGSVNVLAINNNAPHLDKILEFIDYTYSPDGVMKLEYGPQGIVWDIDSNGEPYRTEFGWKYFLDRSTELPGGGGWSITGYVWSGNDPSISLWNLHPVWNRRLDGEDWIKKEGLAPADSALLADWKRVMNAESDLDYYSKNNMLVTPSFAQLPATPEDILVLQQRVGAVVTPESWKMVYAANEAEFEAIWKKMVSDAKGLGADTINQYYIDAYRKAVADGAKYVY